MKIRQTGFAEINETRIFVFFVVRYPKNENKVRKKFRRPNPLPCTLSKTSGDAPAAGDDFFPDSGDRDLSIGEVSAPMDATNKSYGRFKLSFFKTFLVTPNFSFFYHSGFHKIYVSVLQKQSAFAFFRKMLDFHAVIYFGNTCTFG